MGKILIGGVVGGIVIFFWGFVSHMLLPLGEMGMQAIPQEEGLAAAMKNDVPEPGLYFVPGRDMSKSQSQEEMQAHMDKVAKGPYGFMVIYPTGRDVSLGKRLPIELGTNVVCALLAAILVSQLRPGFFVRVACVTLMGISGIDHDDSCRSGTGTDFRLTSRWPRSSNIPSAGFWRASRWRRSFGRRPRKPVEVTKLA